MRDNEFNEKRDREYVEFVKDEIRKKMESLSQELEANPHECPKCNWQCSCGQSPC